MTTANQRAALQLVESKPEKRPRPIRSVYYSDRQGRVVEKVNRSAHARTAVPNAIGHMQLDHYGAMLCEVYDDTTAELHAVIRRDFKRGKGKPKIEILYSRPVTIDM